MNLKVVASGEEITNAIASELEQSDDLEHNMAKLQKILHEHKSNQSNT